MGNWFTMPRLASQHGAALDHTNDIVHWLMLVLTATLFIPLLLLPVLTVADHIKLR